MSKNSRSIRQLFKKKQTKAKNNTNQWFDNIFKLLTFICVCKNKFVTTFFRVNSKYFVPF